MKKESTPYTRCEPAQTIPVLLYSFNLPDFDYKNSILSARGHILVRDLRKVMLEKCSHFHYPMANLRNVLQTANRFANFFVDSSIFLEQ